MKKMLMLCMAITLFGCAKEVEKKEVTIKTTDGQVVYQLEVAKTDEELKNGLMYRESLDADSGMLFLFPETNGIVMWMKNTKISLDMLFVNPEGKIVCIKENATPMSEEYINCNETLSSVIELNAGDVQKHKISVGDSVIR